MAASRTSRNLSLKPKGRSVDPAILPRTESSETATSSSGSRGAVERGEAPLDATAREELIRAAAYLRAEDRGFVPGHELEDWLHAERQVDHWIASRAAPRRYV